MLRKILVLALLILFISENGNAGHSGMSANTTTKKTNTKTKTKAKTKYKGKASTLKNTRNENGAPIMLRRVNQDGVLTSRPIYRASNISVTATLTSFSYAEKKAYIAKMMDEVSELNYKIIDMKNMANRTSGRVNLDAKFKIEELLSDISDLSFRINELINTPEARWQKMKLELDTLLQTVKLTVLKNKAWIKLHVSDHALN